MCTLCDLKTPYWSSRRAFLLAGGASAGLAAVGPVAAQVDVGKSSDFRKLVSAEQLEGVATQQYAKTMGEANTQKILAPDNHPQVLRLRAIARRLIPHAAQWNDRARSWTWQVNLITSKQINAYCMPGGKIAFYSGILEQLALTDDEAAMVMGHEMAHALREHARARMAKTQLTGMAASVTAQLFGLGNLGDVAAKAGTQLLALKYSRDDESEADLVGLELAARSAYLPQAGATLWRKMAAASGKSGGAKFLSTHPSGPQRVRELEANAPKVQGLYEQARKGG